MAVQRPTGIASLSKTTSNGNTQTCCRPIKVVKLLNRRTIRTMSVVIQAQAKWMKIAVKHNYDREGGWGDHVRVKTDSPVLTSDASISINISIREAYALVRTATT